MFTAITSPSLFSSNRRLERPSRQERDANVIKPPQRRESVVASNLHLALSSLSPHHSTKTRSPASLRSPPHSPLSCISSKSTRTAGSTSSMSSGSSIRSHQSSRSEFSPSYRTSYEEQPTPKASSFTDTKARSTTRTKLPLSTASQASLSSRRAIPIHDALLYTPRPSIESVSSSNSCRSFVDLKERRVPPPLYINDSNLHSRNSQEPPVIEIIAPGPPRVESRLSSYSVDPESPAASTPESPAFRMPSEEEVRRRRHEKVMRMLGERVPAELVYRGPKIPNVTMFPDPPMDKDSETAGRETTKAKLARRASFTLSSFPNLSSVTSTLLPTGHGRTKSRDLLELSDSSPSATPTPLIFPRINQFPATIAPTRTTHRSHTRPRPETVYSPIVFSTALEGASAPGSFGDTEAGAYGFTLSEFQRREEAERAAKLSRRASLSTATFLPTSPMRDGFRDINNTSPSSRPHRPRHPEPMSPDQDVYLEIGARPRPESMMLMSPLVFSKHASLVLPPSNQFTLVVDGEDEAPEGEDSDVQDANTAGSRTPPQRTLYVQSEMGHGSAISSGYASNSNPHLPLQPRPETPFQTMGVPPEINSGYLAPPGTWRTSYGRDILQRKERRQGWSGEWNQDDMQDVIKKLRNLK